MKSGGALCCTSDRKGFNYGHRVIMNQRRMTSRDGRSIGSPAQLSLAIGTSGGTSDPPVAAPTDRKRSKRNVEAECIFWMRDVVAITGVHRSTIHRWIDRRIFPPKDAPGENPVGWLRSTIERWLLGSPQRRHWRTTRGRTRHERHR
jgi:predicted DNA-binding transcriptional regulator AlpA